MLLRELPTRYTDLSAMLGPEIRGRATDAPYCWRRRNERNMILVPTRSRLIGLAAAALAVAFAVSGCSPSAVTPSATAAGPVATVTSSITDGQALSAPLTWTATVKPAKGQSVSKVVFSVDGKAEWTEMNAPYFFNDDNYYLYPWLLGSGAHTLGLTVTMNSGSKVSKKISVTATAPAVPAALVGSWSRTVAASDFIAPDNTPTGVWKIDVESNGLIKMGDPTGNGQYEAFTATATGIDLAGTVNWLAPADEQGGFCDPERPNDYTWQVSGSSLTLASPDDSTVCDDRYAVFHGTWTKTG